MASLQNILLDIEDVIAYESGEDSDTWDLQPEEYWRGDDESDLDESESEEEEEATSIEKEIDAYIADLREEETQSHEESDYVLGDVEDYVYQPLQNPEGRTTIRLIQLRPSANFTSPLVCNLSTISIGHDSGELPCRYEALSYTSGAQDFQELLFVLGHRRSTSYMLPITTNLHNALKHLRHKDKDLVVWVDEVCINHSDTDEKNRQLGVMSQIYHYAAKTHPDVSPKISKRDWNCAWSGSRQ